MGTILKNGISYSGSGGGGGGVSSYNELTDKPSIEGVSLTGNKTASDLGLAKASDIPSTDTCYATSDTAETSLADGDYFPFQDVSANGKRKTLWSNVKSTLKTYFDTLYSTTKTRGTATSGGTTLSLVNTGDMYTWNNKQNAIIAGTNLAFSGNTLNASMPAIGTINRSDIYSTTEKVVGCWTDGRPVYQKIVTYNQTSSSATVTTLSFAHNISNLLTIVDASCIWKWHEGQSDQSAGNVPYASTSNFGEQSAFWITKTNIEMFLKPAEWVVSFHFILRYTKSSDSANSYNYASENEYSTSEKIVGKWIDGKTLYQYSFSVSSLQDTSSSEYSGNLIALPSTASTIVSITGMVTNDDTGSAAHALPYVSSDGLSYCRLRVGTSRTNINVAYKKVFTGSCYLWIYGTIQYTKP